MAIVEYQLDTLVTVSGGFHNVGPLRLRIKVGDESLSAGQYKRLKRHLCGAHGCLCNWMVHKIEGINGHLWDRIVFNTEVCSSGVANAIALYDERMDVLYGLEA